jgi:HAD superfamily hydrolase (TIGR01509 family)
MVSGLRAVANTVQPRRVIRSAVAWPIPDEQPVMRTVGMATTVCRGRPPGQDAVMPTSAPPGVIFDVDGTLVDTNWFHTLAWWQAFRARGHLVPMARIHRLIGMGSSRLIAEVLGHEDDEIDDEYSVHYHRLSDDMVAFDGAADLLGTLHRRGIRVVLATSAKPEDVDAMVDTIGAADGVIAHITSSGDADESKPAPEIFQVAMEGGGVDPARSVAVGDTVWDVEASAKAGLPCVGVLTGGISEQELRAAGAVAVYESVTDLLAQLDDSPLAELGR